MLRWFVLLSLYVASRVVALGALPMFLDERIYLRWAHWIALGRRLQVPFVAGKGLSVWMLAGVTPSAAHPLLAGRLVTVAIGLLTLVVVHRLAVGLTGDVRVADLAALFYIACPFTLFHDRMILADGFLAAFTALTLLLALRLAERPRLRDGFALGIAVALGILTKATGLPLLAVPFLVLLLLGGSWRAAAKPLAVTYAVAILLVAYPMWLFFSGGNGELAKLAGAEAEHPPLLAVVSANLAKAASWLWAYWTPGLLLLAAAGFVLAARTRPHRRPAVLLLVLTVAPVAVFAAAARVWFPRYVLFTTVFLVILAAWGFRAVIDVLRQSQAWSGAGATGAAAVLLGLVLLPALRFDLALWTDPVHAPFPEVDRFQYVTGWPSGYGSRETVEFLSAQSTHRPEGLILATPGPSTTASAVRLLWADDPGVEVRLVDPGGPTPADEARPVYVLVSIAEGVQVPGHWRQDLTHAFTSFKPDGTPADELYRVELRPADAATDARKQRPHTPHPGD